MNVWEGPDCIDLRNITMSKEVHNTKVLKPRRVRCLAMMPSTPKAASLLSYLLRCAVDVKSIFQLSSLS